MYTPHNIPHVQKLADFAKYVYHLGALIEDARISHPTCFVRKSAEYSNLPIEMIHDICWFKEFGDCMPSKGWFCNLDKKTENIINELLNPGSIYQPKLGEF